VESKEKQNSYAEPSRYLVTLSGVWRLWIEKESKENGEPMSAVIARRCRNSILDEVVGRLDTQEREVEEFMSYYDIRDRAYSEIKRSVGLDRA
jgi:hypothetical protein